VEATATAVAPSAVLSDRKSPFIVSPGFDAVFFYGSVGAVFAGYVAANYFHVNGFYVLAAVAALSNGPHLASTWTRVYLDKREWKRRPFQILGVPILIAAFVVSMNFASLHGVTVPIGSFQLEPMRGLNSLLLYWATYHFLAQNWGILRIYQRRSGEPDSSLPLRLERPMLYLAVAWCALHRLKTGPRSLFGTEVYFPDLPWAAIDALLAVSGCVLIAYLILRWRDGSLRSSVTWVRMGFLGVAFTGFAVPYLLITQDGTSAFASAAAWHGLQYIGIVRFYHQNAWKGGVNPDAKLMSWVSQPGVARGFFYACVLWALAGAGFLVIWSGSFLTRGTAWTMGTWEGVTWLSLTFGHYYLDGIIWKLSRDKTMAARLLVT
jgi:hypothetical protein